MIKREIKVKFWDKKRKSMSPEIDLISLVEYCRNGGMKDIEGGRNLSDQIPVEYTGLKDKDGKEVYEGDIITGLFENEFGSNTKMRGVVGWCEHNLNWALYPKYEVENSEHYFLDPDCQVVGNIFETPEILK